MGVLSRTLDFHLDVATGFAVIVAPMIFSLMHYWIVEPESAKIVP